MNSLKDLFHFLYPLWIIHYIRFTCVISGLIWLNCLWINKIFYNLINRNLWWSHIIEFHTILILLINWRCFFSFFLFFYNRHVSVSSLFLFFIGWSLQFYICILLTYNWWSITDLWNTQNFILIFRIWAFMRRASCCVFIVCSHTILHSQIIILFYTNVLIEIIASIRQFFFLLFNIKLLINLFGPLGFKLLTFWIRKIGSIINIKTHMFRIFKQSNRKFEINCCKILRSKYVCSKLKHVINVDINAHHWPLILDANIDLLLIYCLIIYLIEFPINQRYFKNVI